MKMSDPSDSHQLIMNSLKEKAGVKIDAFKNLEMAFADLKSILKMMETSIRKEMSKVDKRVVVKFIDRGPYDAEFRVSDDILIFTMHTDIYTFDQSHSLWKTSYVKENNIRAFCGMISVYNFLTDSFNYNRYNDVGYLIARLFINKDSHFFVEGKRQLGFLYNDFDSSVLEKNVLKSVVESSILYSLNFDIYTPPFEEVKVLSVQDVFEKNLARMVKTGKRLGFRFQDDSQGIE
jgi:hypothetical protein